MIYIERLIVRQVLRDLLGAGYLVTVVDPDNTEDIIVDSTDLDAIYNVMFQMDDEYLLVHKPDTVGNQCFVRLIYGNSADVISDYSISLEPVLQTAITLADEIADGVPSPLMLHALELRTALETILPYAESRAEDLLDLQAAGLEDPNYSGADAAWLAVTHAHNLLAKTPVNPD